MDLQRKIASDEKVKTYKIRLVVKSYSQRKSNDYQETFLSMFMLNFIRTLLAIAAYHDEIWLMDVKTAFMNGYLEEDIYIK